MKTSMLLLSALLLSACSSVPVSPSAAYRVPADRMVSHGTPAEGTLPIVITRDSGLGASACATAISIDGAVAAYIRQGEVVTLHVPPGQIIVGAEPAGICPGNLTEVDATIGRGKPAHFRVSIGPGGYPVIQRTAAR